MDPPGAPDSVSQSPWSCSVFRLKRPGQRKKYGLLSNYDDSVEMEAVESDEDDTLYEARNFRRSEVNMLC